MRGDTFSLRVKKMPANSLEFLFEDLDLVFPKSTLEEISQQYESGLEVREIAKNYKCDPDEIFLALFHQARKGKIKTPYAQKIRVRKENDA